jgi:hypothetical protein
VAGIPPQRTPFDPSCVHVGFLIFEVIRFPLLILITPTAPHKSSAITRSWYSRSISDLWDAYYFALRIKVDVA